jgi:hypothetical protein
MGQGHKERAGSGRRGSQGLDTNPWNWHPGSLSTARVRKRGVACDPLDRRFGFKDGGLAWPTLELKSRTNEDSHCRKRRKRLRAAPASQRMLRI